MIHLDQRISHERLCRICYIDYDREMALVANHKNPKTGIHEIIAVGRLSKLHGMNEAEFALIVTDQYQHRGLGTELVRRLLQVAQEEKLRRITAHILSDNYEMQRICEKLGFRLCRMMEESMVRAEIDLAC